MHELETQLFWLVRQIPWPVFVIALAVLVIALIRGLESRPEVGGRTARELLDRLYAGGRISIEEYERRKRSLARAH